MDSMADEDVAIVPVPTSEVATVDLTADESKDDASPLVPLHLLPFHRRILLDLAEQVSRIVKPVKGSLSASLLSTNEL